MSRRRILVFASLLPLPVDRGDKNRLYHLLRVLRGFADVRLVCCRRKWEPIVKDFSLLDGIEIRTFDVSKAEVMWEAAKAILTYRPHTAFYFGMPRGVEFVLEEIQSFKPDVFWGAGIPSFPYLRQVRGIKRILDLVRQPFTVLPDGIASTRDVDTLPNGRRYPMAHRAL